MIHHIVVAKATLEEHIKHLNTRHRLHNNRFIHLIKNLNLISYLTYINHKQFLYIYAVGIGGSRPMWQREQVNIIIYYSF